MKYVKCICTFTMMFCCSHVCCTVSMCVKKCIVYVKIICMCAIISGTGHLYNSFFVQYQGRKCTWTGSACPERHHIDKLYALQ